MGNISETGNAVNISNFKKGIDYCASLGADYAPSNTDLSVANMTTLWTAAKTEQELVNTVLVASKDPINAREILFEPLDKTVTSALNNLKSTKASAQMKKDAKGLADVIRGRNKHAKKLPDGSLNPDFISTSHQSYVMKTDNFQKFVELLNSESLYAPNEVEIQIVTLSGLLGSMQAANDTIGTIIAPLANARISRNEKLYSETGSIWKVFGECKSYISGKYGAKSAQAKYMNALKFRKEKIN